ncbi:MAG: MBL fold metallo-hydrolase, partial [Oscillospiraceae bacterium]|nr:MBL fold metallo-hydrolase [Oscillospiraceae bacterium]
MHWQKITERTEYVSVDESLIGIYHLGGGRVVLIDAGAREEPEFVSDLKERGLSVAALLCSHLHFDHISTAGLLYEEFHMPCYAHYLEEREKEFPTRWFPITRIREDEPLIIEGQKFEVIYTPGHTKGHLAFVTPDSVCCVGDAFMSEKPLSVSKIPFFEDVDLAIESMELVRQT